MKTQELIHDLSAEGFSKLENLLIASHLLSGSHVTGYGPILKTLTMPDTNLGSSYSQSKITFHCL